MTVACVGWCRDRRTGHAEYGFTSKPHSGGATIVQPQGHKRAGSYLTFTVTVTGGCVAVTQVGDLMSGEGLFDRANIGHRIKDAGRAGVKATRLPAPRRKLRSCRSLSL